MFYLDSRGFADLPVVIILCVLLGSLAVGLALKGIDRARLLEDKQSSIDSFDRFVEAGTELSYGGVGGEEKLSLELSEMKISIEGGVVQLLNENEILRSEHMPVPIIDKVDCDNLLVSGNYLLELDYLSYDLEHMGENRLVLVLREVD